MWWVDGCAATHRRSAAKRLPMRRKAFGGPPRLTHSSMAEEELLVRLREAVQGTYTLGLELGGGGMSRIFRASEIATGRAVVLKVLPLDLAAGISLARFKREIDVAGRMQHPNIVPMLTNGDASGLPWFVMPFIEGESLRERINSAGAMPIRHAVRILRDMASALAYAHRQGIVHRDIKPENVLFSGNTAMIADFGVAKALLNAEGGSTPGDGGARLTTRRIALGTPTYMSPEQASGDPRVGTRADIYAWGVVAYELVTGMTPFGGRSLHAQLRAHVKETPLSVTEHRSNVPPYLADLIMRALAKAPSDRPQLAESIVDALDTGMAATSDEAGDVVDDRARDAASDDIRRMDTIAMPIVPMAPVVRPAVSPTAPTLPLHPPTVSESVPHTTLVVITVSIIAAGMLAALILRQA